MTFDDIPVEWRSQGDIDASALPWSRFGKIEGSEVVDVLGVCAQGGIELVPLPDTEMGDDLARAAPSLQRIFVRKSFLSALHGGDLGAKMDLAHEIGHVVLHRGPEMKARKVEGNAVQRFISEEESAEAQASKFARALTMPLAAIRRLQSAEAIAVACEVPVGQARNRLTDVTRIAKKRELPEAVQALLRARKSPGELLEERKASEARERLQIWNKAQRIPGDRTNSRLCSSGKWRVMWSEYQQMTECGWIIREGKIVAWMDLRKD